MSETKLLPCPFCGGEAKIATYDWGYSVKEYWVYCSCGCELKKFHSNEKAVEHWNTRKPMDNIVAELEEKQYQAEKDMGLSEDIDEMNGYGGMSMAYETAIDIVKAGGVE